MRNMARPRWHCCPPMVQGGNAANERGFPRRGLFIEIQQIRCSVSVGADRLMVIPEKHSAAKRNMFAWGRWLNYWALLNPPAKIGTEGTEKGSEKLCAPDFLPKIDINRRAGLPTAYPVADPAAVLTLRARRPSIERKRPVDAAALSTRRSASSTDTLYFRVQFRVFFGEHVGEGALARSIRFRSSLVRYFGPWLP